jgi:Ni2+-binding GTPase involved in maturation of urease and hydrogenase
VAVIEGDQQTSADADRIRATGAPAIQINTGKDVISTGTWWAMRSTI